MYNTGKCPSCGQNPLYLKMGATEARLQPLGGSTLRAITLSCPSCDTILGTQIDPIAVRSEILAGVKALLGKF